MPPCTPRWKRSRGTAGMPIYAPLHETVRFDPITKPHHHVVCVHCKQVSNLQDPKIDALTIPEHVWRRNTVLGHSVYVNVLCAACRVRAGKI